LKKYALERPAVEAEYGALAATSPYRNAAAA